MTFETLECQLCIKDWDDAKWRIQNMATEEGFILERFRNMDVNDGEDQESHNQL